MQFKKFILPVLMLAIFTANGQQISFNLSKGQKVEITTSTKIANTAEVMGQSMETNIESKTTQVAEIKDTRSGENDITLTTSKISASLLTMGQEANYDSDKKDQTGPMAESLSPLLNKPFNFTIDRNGNVIKKDKIESEAGNPGVSAITEKMTELVFIKKSVLGREISTGTTWQDSSSTVNGKTNVKTSGVFKVVSIDNNLVTLSYDGSSLTDGTMEQMGMEMQITSQNKISGTLKLDLATGIVISEESLIISASTVNAGGMEIPVSGKSTYVMTAKII